MDHPFVCYTCSKSFANPGLLGVHNKRVHPGYPRKTERKADPTPEVTLFSLPNDKTSAPSDVTAPSLTSDALDASRWKLRPVCERIEEGLELETACHAVKADFALYHRALRNVASRSPSTTDEERGAVAAVQQASAEFELDLLRKLSSSDRVEVAGAEAKSRICKERFRRRNLQLEYNAQILMDIAKRHVSEEQFDLILQDLSELDANVAIIELDEKMGCIH